jgi:hypothetical protein
MTSGFLFGINLYPNPIICFFFNYLKLQYHFRFQRIAQADTEGATVTSLIISQQPAISNMQGIPARVPTSNNTAPADIKGFFIDIRSNTKTAVQR